MEVLAVEGNGGIEMLTMRDVAERAGVSRATVSVVLNDRADAVGINEETRRRVLASAEELGYKRNELVRAAITGRNRMLGFLVWRPEYEPVARMLGGALDEAEKRDYTIKVLRLRDRQIDRRTIDRCLELRLSGIIVVKVPPRPLETLHSEMRARGVPVTTLGSSFAQGWGTRVAADDALGMRQLVEHLYGLGHRRIAFIGGDPEDAAAVGREHGFRKAMSGLGLPVRENFVEHGQWSIEPTLQAARHLLALSEPPTAIVCASDEMASSTCRAARNAGLQVPRDLSVAGFTDIGIAALCDPPLTTVALPFETMGAAAVRSTLERVEQSAEEGDFRDGPAEHILPPRFTPRESTAPLPP